MGFYAPKISEVYTDRKQAKLYKAPNEVMYVIIIVLDSYCYQQSQKLNGLQ